MAGTGTEGGKVTTEGVFVGGVAAEAPTMGARTVALVSMVKFLKLLKMQPAKGRKKKKDISNKWEQEQELEDRWMPGSRLILYL